MITNKIILFKGTTCAPCKVFVPSFLKFIEDKEFDGEVQVETDNVELMREYGLRQVPSLVLLGEDSHKVLTGRDLRFNIIEAAIFDTQA